VRHVPEVAQQQVEGIRISLDGRPVTSETTATAAGPSVLVLITALRELGVTITSTYIGHANTHTLAAHLVVTRDRRTLEHVEHSRDALPVTHARARCLLDHAQQLQDALVAHPSGPVAIDVAPGALARAIPV
jgi:hypothetical protein